MTVGELIELLDKQDPDLPVVFGHVRSGEPVRLVYCTVPHPARVVLAR